LETSGFLSQQAREKALKSRLYYTGARRAALEDARMLDLHYIPSRYPNGLPSGYRISSMRQKRPTAPLPRPRRS
jgi:HEPN domain-containing protein